MTQHRPLDFPWFPGPNLCRKALHDLNHVRQSVGKSYRSGVTYIGTQWQQSIPGGITPYPGPTPLAQALGGLVSPNPDGLTAVMEEIGEAVRSGRRCRIDPSDFEHIRELVWGARISGEIPPWKPDEDVQHDKEWYSAQIYSQAFGQKLPSVPHPVRSTPSQIDIWDPSVFDLDRWRTSEPIASPIPNDEPTHHFGPQLDQETKEEYETQRAWFDLQRVQTQTTLTGVGQAQAPDWLTRYGLAQSAQQDQLDIAKARLELDRLKADQSNLLDSLRPYQSQSRPASAETPPAPPETPRPRTSLARRILKLAGGRRS